MTRDSCVNGAGPYTYYAMTLACRTTTRAHRLAIDRRVFPQSPPELVEVPPHPMAHNWVKSALKTAQHRCAGGTTIKQKRITDVGDEGFPHHAERGQTYDLRHDERPEARQIVRAKSQWLWCGATSGTSRQTECEPLK